MIGLLAALTLNGRHSGKMNEIVDIEAQRSASVSLASLYHGSRAQFSSFRSGRSGMVFLSENPEFSAQYGNVREVELDDVRIADLESNIQARALAISAYNETAGRPFDLTQDEFWQLTDGKQVLAAVKAAGYDALRFRETSSDGTVEGTTIAVFCPGKIRWKD